MTMACHTNNKGAVFKAFVILFTIVNCFITYGIAVLTLSTDKSCLILYHLLASKQ